MPRSIEILSYESEIILIRREWSNKIDLDVNIKASGFMKIKKLFAADKMIMKVGDLANDQNYKVKVSAKHIFDKLRNPSLSIDIPLLNANPEILIIGSGRSGTTSIAEYLDGLQYKDGKKVCSKHETLFEYLLPVLNNEKEIVRYFKGFRHNIESAPHLTRWAGKLPVKKVIHIIRDGRRVVQSGLNRGWYQKDDIWESIKPDFDGSTFEKCCKFWVYQVRMAEKYATKTIRLEDVSKSNDELQKLLEYLEICPTDKTLPIANIGKKSSKFTGWNTHQNNSFKTICGSLMDKYYPGWSVSE